MVYGAIHPDTHALDVQSVIPDRKDKVPQESHCSSIAMDKPGVVITGVAFCTQLITFGCVLSIGVYTMELLEYYSESESTIGLIGSISLLTFFGLGPLSSYLLTKLPHWILALIGAIIANIGYIALPFSPNVPYIIVFYSVLVGSGSNLAFMASTILAGEIRTKYQNIVQSLIKLGSGIGPIVVPILYHYFIVLYGWKGSFYIVSGLNLHLIPLALLLSIVEKPNEPKTCNRSQPLNEQVSIESESSTRNEVASHKSKCCKTPKSLSFLLNLNYILYLLSTFLWNISNGSLLIFLPTIAVSVGLDRGDAAMCLTFFSIGVTFGTITNAIIGSFFNRFMSDAVVLIFGGIAAFLLSFDSFHTMSALFTLSCMFGVSVGVLVSLLLVLTTDCLGIEHMPTGFGVIIFTNGLGGLLGPIIHGAVSEATGSIKIPMYAMGLNMVLAAVMVLLVAFRRRNASTSVP